MRKYIYKTNCTRSSASALELMYEKSRAITFETFTRKCEWRELAKSLGYSVFRENGLKLKNDYCVSFYKSEFEGQSCYYMVQSCIDHIFLKID